MSYTQKHLSEAVEIILGISHDPAFGPVVVLGLGGIFVELLQDSVLMLPPLNHAEALKMIQKLKYFQCRPLVSLVCRS